MYGGVGVTAFVASGALIYKIATRMEITTRPSQHNHKAHLNHGVSGNPPSSETPKTQQWEHYDEEIEAYKYHLSRPTSYASLVRQQWITTSNIKTDSYVRCSSAINFDAPKTRSRVL
ncbi:hypothetical protein INR49_000764 [Caranx melampygus]|nr:hypothetical protein INR49_000764 [Caranx melampygus]